MVSSCDCKSEGLERPSNLYLLHLEPADNITDLNADKASYNWSNSAPYNANRPSQSSLDMLYAQRDLADAQKQSATAYHRNSDPTTYVSTPSYQSRGSFESSHTQLTEYPVRQPPEITSYTERGTSGSALNVSLRSDYDLLAPPALVLSLTFATKRVLVDITRLETTGPLFEYMLFATVPQYSETGSTTSQVHIRLQMQEASGQDAGVVDVGRFEYVASQLQHSPQRATLKRKMSDEPGDAYSNSYPYTPTNPGAYPASLHSIDLSSMQRRFTPYGRSQNQQRYRDPSSMPATLPSQSLMRPPVSQASNWSPSFTTLGGRNPSMTGETQSLSLSSSESNPVLVRTTTLQQSGSPGSAQGQASSGGFNPYMYPQKAILKIHGELNSMTEDWTPDEWASKRRLVQFTRSQHKSTINAEFAPVAPEDRQPNSICISCIWWEERQECFATSVDTIQLLEQLVALRFTVEEKNRIRRNLEGFHPETVSKGKADSEEFFKIIMGFPNPKPRNIEKDVKVFPWKILGHALKKIISKYVCSSISHLRYLLTLRSQQATPQRPAPSAPLAMRSPTATTHPPTKASPPVLTAQHQAHTPLHLNPPPCPPTASPANTQYQTHPSRAPSPAYPQTTASPPSPAPTTIIQPTSPTPEEGATHTTTTGPAPPTSTNPHATTNALAPTPPTQRSTPITKLLPYSAKCPAATPITAVARAYPVWRSRTPYRRARGDMRVKNRRPPG